MFKQMLSVLNVNLINFVLRILFTFILGDVFKIDYEVYYPLLLTFLIYIGYLLHAKYTFKSSSKTILLKYVIHLIFFNILDYFFFVYINQNFEILEAFATFIVTCTLWIFKFLNLKFLVFTKDINSDENSRNLYNRIANNYDSFHNDKFSQKYYKEIISNNIITDDFDKKKILEAMCGGGNQFTKSLYELETDLTVLDVSDKFINLVQEKFPGINAVRSSLLDFNNENERFDIICIIGGLHEVHPNIDDFMQKLHTLLKTNGKLYVMEPHSNSLFNIPRFLWYKFDNNFNNNEGAISVSKLIKNNSDIFKVRNLKYYGFIGYLFVMQSGNFRIPIQLKKIYSPLLIKLEPIFNKILPKYFKTFFILELESI